MMLPAEPSGLSRLNRQATADLDKWSSPRKRYKTRLNDCSKFIGWWTAGV